MLDPTESKSVCGMAMLDPTPESKMYVVMLDPTPESKNVCGMAMLNPKMYVRVKCMWYGNAKSYTRESTVCGMALQSKRMCKMLNPTPEKAHCMWYGNVLDPTPESLLYVVWQANPTPESKNVCGMAMLNPPETPWYGNASQKVNVCGMAMLDPTPESKNVWHGKKSKNVCGMAMLDPAHQRVKCMWYGNARSYTRE
ncbi:unnamed protein product [Mytilus edulis]|uniref:Uncharacterized protein n=1 Tax=Mytilus edulis TaxID=6550 RepID=A0A8S3QWT5_MYTED|nr:unnamed protein product [Mytilus edulis]